eukprot:357663-Chlamydomonas_euryale.AAC.8
MCLQQAPSALGWRLARMPGGGMPVQLKGRLRRQPICMQPAGCRHMRRPVHRPHQPLGWHAWGVKRHGDGPAAGRLDSAQRRRRRGQRQQVEVAAGRQRMRHAAQLPVGRVDARQRGVA